MSIEAIILCTGALAYGIAGVLYIRWSRARLERTDPNRRPAE